MPPGAVTIFSAHGVSRAVELDAEARGLSVLDAVCPLVAKVHHEGQRYLDQGRVVILIGHAGHPEIEGTMGQLKGEVHLIQSKEDVERLTIPRRCACGLHHPDHAQRRRHAGHDRGGEASASRT